MYHAVIFARTNVLSIGVDYMSYINDKLTCLECGEEFDSNTIDTHMEQMHSLPKSNKMSRAQHRLQAKSQKSNSGLKIGAGIILIIIILLAASLVFFQPQDEDNNKLNFQETEEQPEVVSVPKDDDSGNQNNDQNNDNNNDSPDTNDNVDDEPNTDDNGTVVDPEPEILILQVPVSEITTEAKWYPYDFDGVEIRFFAVRSSDNEIHVAFDACDVCYEAKMGYRQDGIKMVCNNCDKSFPIRAIGTDNLAGGCWPSYLPMDIEDDNVIIKITDLEDKKYMFE
jgi:hypothetical protein